MARREPLTFQSSDNDKILLDKAGEMRHYYPHKHMNTLLLIARWWWPLQRNAA